MTTTTRLRLAHPHLFRRALPRPVSSALAALALFLFISAPSSRAQTCDAWAAQFPASQPSPRTGHAMCYDTARDRVVLFSGASSGVYQTSTWEYNGANWLVFNPALRPSPRAGHAMAYDEANAKTILFSGFSGSIYETSTWQWNGSAWSFTTPNPSPSARAGHALIYESGRSRILLFGGSNTSGYLNDTWEWNTATGAWTNITPAGDSPPARYSHAFAWDSVRQRAVLYGGYGSAGALIDTWEFDPVAGTWTQFSAPSPGAFYSYTMQFDPLSARCILIGGAAASTQYNNTVWEWNGVSWTHDSTASDGRAYPASVYDRAHERILIFGGLAGDPAGIHFEVDGTATLPRTPWRLVNANGPGSRRFHSMSADSTHSNIVLFGGLNAAVNLLGDTWTWNGSVWTFAANTGPSARYGAPLADDPAGAGVILFGGAPTTDISAVVNDTWRWNGSTWSELFPAHSPSARGFHTLTYDPIRNVVLLFGGEIGNTTFNDTWEWDGADWTQVFPAHSPPARALASMCFDARSGRTLLFGGYTLPFSTFNDTWAWDGADWTFVPSSSPPTERYSPALAFDAARDAPVLYGGQAATTRSDTFDWTNDSWRFLTSSAPVERVTMAYATDPVRGSALIHGGFNNNNQTLYLDTWATRPASPVLVTPLIDTSAGATAAVTFSAETAGAGPLTYLWRKDGVALTDDAVHIFGASSRTLLIDPAAVSDSGDYSVHITNSCGTTITAAATLSISNPCAPDLNADGVVNSSDLALLLGNWGDSGGNGPADLDHNATVNSADLALLLGTWGPCA